jgi:hypothetical protein
MWVILGNKIRDPVYTLSNLQLSGGICSPLRWSNERCRVGGWQKWGRKALSETNDFHSLQHQDLTSISPTILFAVSLAVEHGVLLEAS